MGTGVKGPPKFRVRESKGLSKFWSSGNTGMVRSKMRYDESYTVGAVTTESFPNILIYSANCFQLTKYMTTF